MKIQSILIAAALAVSIPSTALAESGFFVAGSLGKANLSENFDDFNVDTDSTAFRITAGWRFNDYFAVEAGYNNFGRFEQTVDVEGVPTEISLEADGFTLGGLGFVPLGDRFSLFARAGAYFWDGNAEINSATAAKPEDANFYFGAGIRFALSDKLSATADGSRYDLDGASSTVFSVGLDIRF